MTDIDAVDERLRAVERAVADGDADADLVDPTGELTERVDDLESTTAEIEAGLQAVRGYVGEVRSTDDDLAARADAALAAVDDAEDGLDDIRERLDAVEKRLQDGGVEMPKPSQDAESDGSRPDADRGGDTSDIGRDDATPSPDPSPRGTDRPGDRRRPPTRGDGAATEHATDHRTRNAPRQPRQQRQPAGSQTATPRSADTRRHCPHCGVTRGDDHTTRPDQPENHHSDERDADPIEDVDEQGIVARLRNAL
ncbi:hypothetical protein SAMN06269185_2000 [Natronoarchaeum philippinense]|uniref:DUF7310 domain-containing protein n=1 Tax=Natronoarchaeum philippinense TaxID=558529 RepID=A0A285NVM1_NATPI|nr:hypothetical protein [Natronoarchaeum philippinense]SNZ12973.1 hypothetical protein SAMN06269185_2000 [Natronoarchaeum philippinense]